jgi:hypothetical protein
MSELDDDDDDLSPRARGNPDNLRLVRHEVQTNAARLTSLEKKYEDLADVQERLLRFARRRKQEWKNYRYYTKVLFDEAHKS